MAQSSQADQTQKVLNEIYGDMQQGFVYEEVQANVNENVERAADDKKDEWTCSQFVTAVLNNQVTLVTPQKKQKKFVMTPELYQRVCSNSMQ